MKADKTRRRITFEALDSGIPDVANVGNLGEVWLASLLRGETPRHSRLIHSRRALSAFIILIFVCFVKIFFGFSFGFLFAIGILSGRGSRLG